MLRGYDVCGLVGVIYGFGPELGESFEMGVEVAASDLVSARFGGDGVADAGQQRADQHHRTAERRIVVAELLAAQEFHIDVLCAERPLLIPGFCGLAAHIPQQSDEIPHVCDVRDVVDCDFVSGEQGRAQHLQSLVLRSLGSDFAVQGMSAFYFKRCHLLILLIKIIQR